jgi:uncharacterized membrane protein
MFYLMLTPMAKAEQQLTDQSTKTMSALRKKKAYGECYKIWNFVISFSLLHWGTANYISEILDIYKCNNIEKVHTVFCKQILSVKKRWSNVVVYSEQASVPFCMIAYLHLLWTKGLCYFSKMVWKRFAEKKV